VISYLTGRTSRDIKIAAAQRTTRMWWESAESRFDLYISRLVLLEAGAGDPEAAKRRLSAVKHLPRLTVTPECLVLAQNLRREAGLPKKAVYDALHLAIAAVYGLDYLVTWDFRHLASESRTSRIRSIIVSWGHASPVICTPSQFER
jgi:predicted nucleic acid-binding protein